MAKIDLQVAIALSPEAVYRTLLDLPRRPDLDPTIVGFTFVPETASEGALFSGSGSLSGAEERFEGLVTGLEPDSFAAFGFNYANGAHLHEQWRLRPVPSGTLINYHAEMSLPGGFIGKLLDAVLVGGGFRKQREAMLAHAKAVLESGAASPGV